MNKVVWLFIVSAVLFFLVIIIVATKVKVFLSYYHGQDDDHLQLLFKAWFGLIKYKLDIPLIKIDDDSPTIVMKEKLQSGPREKTKKKDVKQYSAEDLSDSFNDMKELIHHVFGLHKIIRKFLKKVAVKQLEWYSVAGIGDAAHTGMLTGALWAVKGSIIGIISHYMELKIMPKVIITPSFQKAISQTTIKCMFQFRIGHAMLAGIKLVKYWKGGRPKFRRKPLSVLSGDKTKSV